MVEVLMPFIEADLVVPPSLEETAHTYFQGQFEAVRLRMENPEPLEGYVFKYRPERNAYQEFLIELSPEEKIRREKNRKIKIPHIHYVWGNANMLMDMMGGKIEGKAETWDTDAALASVWIHDARRAYESMIYGTYSTGVDRYNHGAFAALGYFVYMKEKYKDSIRNDAVFRRRLLLVTQAACYHGDMNVPESAMDNDILRLLRDADKLAILYELEGVADHFTGEPVLGKGGMSEHVLTEIIAGARVKNIDIRTRSDALARVFVWFRELNFTAAKELWVQRGYSEALLAKLRQWELSPDVYVQVKRAVKTIMEGEGFELNEERMALPVAA